METLLIRYTRGDAMTQPGGFILRVDRDKWGPGRDEFVAHTFNRDYGSKTPREFFWGRYCREREDAERAYREKVGRAERYTTGGSLIPDHLVDYEIKQELEACPQQ